MSRIKLLSLLVVAAASIIAIVSAGHPRVSRSFVRGFLVGYAKGLQEGRQVPVLHQVACAFHPLPEHEPILNDVDPAYQQLSEPEQDGGYSNNHVTHSSSSSSLGSGMHRAGGSGGGGGGGREGSDPDDKKAASTNAIPQLHKASAQPSMQQLQVTYTAPQPRQEVVEVVKAKESANKV